MVKKQLHYLSYLLRLWPASRDTEATWHASLENPHTGQRLGFANLEDLLQFLKEEISVATDTSGAIVRSSASPNCPYLPSYHNPTHPATLSCPTQDLTSRTAATSRNHPYPQRDREQQPLTWHHTNRRKRS